MPTGMAHGNARPLTEPRSNAVGCPDGAQGLSDTDRAGLTLSGLIQFWPPAALSRSARESSTSDDLHRSPSRTSVGTAGTLLALSIEQHSAFHPYERLDHAIPPITLRSPPDPRGLLARAATSHSASGASDRGAGSASAGARSSARRGAAPA